MEQGAEPVLQWDGVGGGPGCTGFRQLALHTCCRAQRPAAVSNRFLLAFSLRSLSQKVWIIVTAGSEWGKKKSGKEKSIKITFFSPSFRPGVPRVRDEGSSMLVKILQNIISGKSKDLFRE